MYNIAEKITLHLLFKMNKGYKMSDCVLASLS